MPPYDIREPAFVFACQIVDFCKPLFETSILLRQLGRQLLAAGTSIAANLEEADGGETKPDFRHKVAISRKEAREARYWLRLVVHAAPRLHQSAAPLIQESSELVAILTTIKKNAERSPSRGNDAL